MFQTQYYVIILVFKTTRPLCIYLNVDIGWYSLYRTMAVNFEQSDHWLTC